MADEINVVGIIGNIGTISLGNKINGTNGDDTISKNGGHNTMYGFGGNDSITTDSGNDFISGGSGDDKIFSSSGQDTIYGEDGNDTISYLANGNNLVHAGDGDDYIGYVSLILTNGGIGFPTTTHTSGGLPFQIGIQSTDTISIDLLDHNSTISRTILNKITTTSAITVDNTSYGISSVHPSVFILGNLDNATYGNNTIYGGSGDDTIFGSIGLDNIVGGEGNDLFEFVSSQGIHHNSFIAGGNDVIWDFNLTDDKIKLTNLVNNFSDIEIKDNSDGNAVLYLFEQTITLNGIKVENLNANHFIIEGSRKIDNSIDFSIYSTNDNDLIAGTTNDDNISAKDGNDIIYGYDGKDTLYGGNGNDYIDAGTGDDSIYTNSSINNSSGYLHHARIMAINPKVVYLDNLQSDTIYGGEGNDKIYSSDGNHHLYSGDGKDSFLYGYQNNIGTDIIYDFDVNNDLIKINGLFDIKDWGSLHSSLHPYNGKDILQDDDFGNAILRLGEYKTVIFSGVSRIELLPENFEITGNPYDTNIIIADSLFEATKNSDLMGGNVGNQDDTISAGLGNDTVYGYSGDDVINGGYGYDYLDGGDGNDYLEGGINNDTIYGGAGDDTLVGGHGENYLIGGDGNDVFKFSGDGFIDIIFDFNVNEDKLDAGRVFNILNNEDGNAVLYLGTLTAYKFNSSHISERIVTLVGVNKDDLSESNFDFG